MGVASSSPHAPAVHTASLGFTIFCARQLRVVPSLITRLRVMKRNLSKLNNSKQLAGYAAVDNHVRSGMLIGLGTGSTAFFATERVGQKISNGELQDIACVPTSERTKSQAESLNIPLCTMDDIERPLDVAIDGADAVDSELNLMKGGGGAMHREKMIAIGAKRFIVIVDDSKLCHSMGPHFPVPVEISQFAYEYTIRRIVALPAAQGCTPILRRGSSTNNKLEPGEPPAITDNGNYIVDLEFDNPIANVADLAQLKELVGVVDHGVFLNMTTQVIIAGENGITIAGEGGDEPWW